MNVSIQKKLLYLMAAAVMAFILLAGCSKSSADNQTSAPEHDAAQPLLTETEAPVTTEADVTEPETTVEPTTEEPTTEEPTTEEQTFAPVEIKEVNETVWSTTSLNVREFWDKDAKKLGSLKKGQVITRTGICENGWSQIQFKGQVAYVSSKYLTDKEPVVETAPPTQAPVTGETQPGATAPETTAPPVATGPAAGKSWCSLGDSITAQQGWQSVVTSTLGFSNEYVVGKPGAVYTSGQEESWFGDYAMAVKSDVDYVIVMGGINDLIFNKEIGDITTAGTFKNGMNRTIEKVRDYAPNAKIIVVTPLNTYGAGNQIGLSLSDYATAAKEVAQNQGCSVIDLFNDGTFTPDNQATYTTDSIHLNSTGKQKLGEVLAGYLKDML